MSGGRPRTRIGTYGLINVRVAGRKHVASTRVRDQDGKLRRVVATGTSKSGATALAEHEAGNIAAACLRMCGVPEPAIDAAALAAVDLLHQVL